MIHEIQAKTLLSSIRQPDPVFGLRYNFNLYRGCPHACIYCDSRSECYGIENFEDVLVKVNAIELLERELPRKRVKGIIGTGSMSDPYMPVERRYNLTGRALQVIARYGFPVRIITKSDLVLKDLEILKTIQRQSLASVLFTLTTVDDDLARKVEPGAPLPSRRLAAMRTLAEAGVQVAVAMMPILPFLEDNPDTITQIVEAAAQHGAQAILSWLGMSLRDRQRQYYYTQLDRHFPGVRQKYERAFGNRYGCIANQAAKLEHLLQTLCQQHGVKRELGPYPAQPEARQLQLW